MGRPQLLPRVGSGPGRRMWSARRAPAVNGRWLRREVPGCGRVPLRCRAHGVHRGRQGRAPAGGAGLVPVLRVGGACLDDGRLPDAPTDACSSAQGHRRDGGAKSHLGGCRGAPWTHFRSGGQERPSADQQIVRATLLLASLRRKCDRRSRTRSRRTVEAGPRQQGRVLGRFGRSEGPLRRRALMRGSRSRSMCSAAGQR